MLAIYCTFNAEGTLKDLSGKKYYNTSSGSPVNKSTALFLHKVEGIVTMNWSACRRAYACGICFSVS